MPTTSRLDAARFLLWDGLVQHRYEASRAYMLLPYERRQRTAPARFYLARLTRYGLLGLLDRDPLGRAWGWNIFETRQVELVPIGAADTTERMTRLYAVLYGLITKTAGGDQNAASGTIRTGFYRNAGEGTNNSEPVSVYLAVR